MNYIKVLSQELSRVQMTALKVFSTFRVEIATMLEQNLSKMSLTYWFETQQIRNLLSQSWIKYFIKSVKLLKVLMKSKQPVKKIRFLSHRLQVSPGYPARPPRHQLIWK